jgi:hypothetical protein
MIEHKDFSPFEYACQLGNLMSLKLILSHQEPFEFNPIYINGLLLSIHHHQFEVIKYLFELNAYQPIIQKHRKLIVHEIQEAGLYELLKTFEYLLEPDLLHEQIELPLEEFKTQDLHLSEQIVLKDLAAYYQTSISCKSLKKQLHDIQGKIAHLYQLEPISYSLLNGESISLPLTYESLLTLKVQHHETEFQNMIQAYLIHPIHSAWRFLQTENHWNRQANSLFAYGKEVQWLLILMWHAASDQHFINYQEISNIQERIELFIFELASFEMQALANQALINLLLKAVMGHSLCSIFDQKTLKLEHQSFLKKHWTQQLNQYCVLSHDNQKLISSCVLSETDNQVFEELMTKKWGSRWTDNLHLIKQSRQQLFNPNLRHQYHHLFQNCLNSAIQNAQKGPLNQYNFFNIDWESSEQQPLNHHHKIN